MPYFNRYCVECNYLIYIDDESCSKCGYDYKLHPLLKPLCPYCEKELHLSDFYTTRLDKKGRKRARAFKGEFYGSQKLWHCPFCGKILGFSDWASR